MSRPSRGSLQGLYLDIDQCAWMPLDWTPWVIEVDIVCCSLSSATATAYCIAGITEQVNDM